MIDPDGFFIKLFPTVWKGLDIDLEDSELVSPENGAEIGLPLEDLASMNRSERLGRLAAVRTLRIVEAALSQVKKIREDRDRDVLRNRR